MGAARQTLSAAARGLFETMQTASSDINGSTLPAMAGQLSDLSELAVSLAGAVGGAAGLVDQAQGMLDQLASTLESGSEALGQTDSLLSTLLGELEAVETDVSALQTASALESLLGEDSLNASLISDFMGSPTQLVTEQLYPLNAYGSAMAPLFMNLTFWIGAFMLVVVMRQEVDSEGIRNLKLYQRYLGRFLLMAVMVVLQAVICCAGLLLIGVQAVSVPALFFAAVCTALSYLSIIFALSLTLQHIGKGICVLLVFAQIPGATGLYPVEMTSSFFQAVYPFMPFTYGINALREAICGFYGAQYAQMIAVLALFFALFLALGLLFRPLLANVNLMVSKQVREGGIYNGEDVQAPIRPYRFSHIVRALARSRRVQPRAHPTLCALPSLVPAHHPRHHRGERRHARRAVPAGGAHAGREGDAAHHLAFLDRRRLHRHHRGGEPARQLRAAAAARPHERGQAARALPTGAGRSGRGRGPWVT